MKAIVVYYSKTGNTKTIAETISQEIGATLIPLNLIKKGRKTKEEKEIENQYFNQAITESRQADIVFIGTPTEFRKPHPKIMEFIDRFEAKRVVIYCTYYGMLGATIYDLEARLLQKDIKVVDKLNISVGTEKYKFNQDIRQYKEKITPEHLQTAKDFALSVILKQNPLKLRLKGVCGKDCQTCQEFNKSCKGAGYSCWSGVHCEIYNCCVTKKSFLTCGECNFRLNCDKLKNVKCNFD
jgi:flavodoxin